MGTRRKIYYFLFALIYIFNLKKILYIHIAYKFLFSFSVMNCIRKFKKSELLKTSFKTFIQNHGMKTMQAWQAFEYGGPDKLQLNTTAQSPIIRSPLDVLVKVHAASVNPLDVRMLGMCLILLRFFFIFFYHDYIYINFLNTVEPC